MIAKIESISPPVIQYTIDSSADAASLPHSGIPIDKGRKMKEILCMVCGIWGGSDVGIH